MYEIEKMLALQTKVVNEEEQHAVNRAVIVLRDMFPQLINGTRDVLLGKEHATAPIDTMKEALQLLHRCGKEHGIDFPSGETEEETIAYVIKLGREILASDRK